MSNVSAALELQADLERFAADWLRALGMTDPEQIGAVVAKMLTVGGGRAAAAMGTASSYYYRLAAGVPVADAVIRTPRQRFSRRRSWLPGTRRGTFTVVGDISSGGRSRRIELVCDCGTVIHRDASSLNRFVPACPGCAPRGARLVDGEVFAGTWVVVGDYDQAYRQSRILIRCRGCGEERTVDFGLRRRGGPKRCGCNPAPAPKAHPGARFGRWLVVGYGEPADDKQRTRRVVCRCDCGREKVVQVNNLVSGKSTRCASCAARAREARRKSVPGPGADL